MNSEQITEICQKNNLGTYQTKKYLGQGENHHNILIITNTQKVVLRYAIRDSKNIKKEFELMQKVPEGFAPKTIAYGTIDKEEYALQEFIEGNRPTHTKEVIKEYAKRIAELHNLTWTNKKITKNIYAKTKKEMNEVKKEIPHVFNNDKNELVEQVLKYLQTKNHHFKDVEECLVHGDIIFRNSIQTEHNLIFIDWEWGSYNECSRDLAGFYYPGSGRKTWQTYLTSEEENIFLEIYCNITKQEKTKLLPRIRSWQIYVATHDYLWFSHKVSTWKEQIGEDTLKDYEEAVKNTLRVIKDILKTN